MLQVDCPFCEKRFHLGDDRADRMTTCPACQKPFRAVRTDPVETNADDEALATQELDEWMQARPGFGADGGDEFLPAREQEVRDRSESETPTPGPLGPRKKRRKKRRRSPSGLAAMNPLWLAAVGGVVLFAFSLGLTFLMPSRAILVLGLGWLLMTLGWIWITVVAFHEDMMNGLLCAFVPVFAPVYALANLGEARHAALLYVAGLAVMGGAVVPGMF